MSNVKEERKEVADGAGAEIKDVYADKKKDDAKQNVKPFKSHATMSPAMTSRSSLSPMDT